MTTRLISDLKCPKCGECNIGARDAQALQRLNKLAERRPVALLPCFACTKRATEQLRARNEWRALQRIIGEGFGLYAHWDAASGCHLYRVTLPDSATVWGVALGHEIIEMSWRIARRKEPADLHWVDFSGLSPWF